MLDILDAPDHVAAYRISGKLTADDFDRVVEHLEAKLARHERVGVVVDMTGFHDLTLEAAGKDLRYGFSKIAQLKRFPRKALITDKQWVRAVVGAAGAIVPFVEVRTFESEESAAAIAWAADI